MPRSTYVISLTPFDEAGVFDAEDFRRHLRRLGDSGIGVYVAGGGSGEGYTLDTDETEQVLHIAAEELKGRVSVRAMGHEPRTAKEMVEFGRLVAASGLEEMQVYSLEVGHGIPPTNREIERYLDDVLSSIEVKAIISTHQSVGYKIPVDVFESVLDRYEHVIGINHSHGDIRYLTQLVDAFADRVEIHVGGTQQALAAMALGATGYLTSEGNLTPRLCVSVTDFYEQGDIAASHRAFAQVLRLFTANGRYGSIRGLKAALKMLGLPGGYPRLPRLPVTDAERDEIAKTLAELDVEELR